MLSRAHHVARHTCRRPLARASGIPVERLLNAAAGLADRLGPVLLQLPPNLPANVGALDACLREFSRFPASDQSPSTPAAEPTAPVGRRGAAEATDSPVRVAVEFRHESWWTEEIRQLLERYNAALCWADRIGHPVTPLWRTADWGYLGCTSVLLETILLTALALMSESR